jgi:hypothetical protein
MGQQQTLEEAGLGRLVGLRVAINKPEASESLSERR